MRGPCECCLDNERVRPQMEYRVVETELGSIGLRLCGPCSSALTISIERHAQAAKAIPRTYFITEDERGEKLACEVH